MEKGGTIKGILKHSSTRGPIRVLRRNAAEQGLNTAATQNPNIGSAAKFSNEYGDGPAAVNIDATSANPTKGSGDSFMVRNSEDAGGSFEVVQQPYVTGNGKINPTSNSSENPNKEAADDFLNSDGSARCDADLNEGSAGSEMAAKRENGCSVPWSSSYKDSLLSGSSVDRAGAENTSDNGDSFAAKSFQSEEGRKVNFRFVQSASNIDDFDVVISKESVKIVQERYKHVLYGYFLGNRLAYPVVDYYAKNAWAKYGLKRIMMNSNGFFFFKFDSAEGMESVLRDGPWLIRNNPIFLNVWSSSVILKKEEMSKIAVWVKLHDVPLAAYTEDGLSMLASKIGIPKMLDRYTSDMCLDSWGRSSYARAIIEISAEKDLKDSISVAVPNLDGEGFTRAMVQVEYEWNAPRCSNCCVFGHTLETCPKCVKIPVTKIQQVITDNNGYTEVKRRNKNKQRVVGNKPKPRVEYRPVQKQKVFPSKSPQSKTHLKSNSNPFMNLKGYDSNGVPIDDFEEEGMEDVKLEKDPRLKSVPGASTPTVTLSDG